MMTELYRILPRHPKREVGYLTDFLIAFLPAIIMTCLFVTKSILMGMAVCLLLAFISELVYSYFVKKEADLTVLVRALIICVCIPCNSAIWVYALGGVLIFALGTLRRFTDRYVSLEPIIYTMLILIMLTHQVSSPTQSVVEGVKFGNVAVWDLLMGYKSVFFGAGSIFALAFAYIYLSIRKRIKLLYGLLFYSVLIAVMAFLYEDGGLNAIYYVSFVALDANVFLGSLVLVSMGVLPFEKKAAYLFSILGGGALGLITLKLGAVNGIYYILALLCLLARPTELMICKLRHKKTVAEL